MLLVVTSTISPLYRPYRRRSIYNIVSTAVARPEGLKIEGPRGGVVGEGMFSSPSSRGVLQ